jgi:hypothetical protein
MVEIPLEIRNEFIALRQEIRDLRKDVGVILSTLRRLEDNQFSYRDELRTLYQMHRDLRDRLVGADSIQAKGNDTT